MLSGVVMEQIVWFVCGIYYPSLGIGETIIAALELSVWLEDLMRSLPILSFCEKSSLLSFWHKYVIDGW